MPKVKKPKTKKPKPDDDAVNELINFLKNKEESSSESESESSESESESESSDDEQYVYQARGKKPVKEPVLTEVDHKRMQLLSRFH